MNSFSKTEKQVWLDTEIFFTKQRIIDKIYQDGSLIIEHIKSTSFFNELKFSFQNPKISKGENYLGLPWVMVDFPCIFSHENIFAFRVFYHWGKEINCFLILKGVYFNHFLPSIKQNFEKEDFNKILIYKGANIWQHHIDENYSPLLFNTEIDELAKKQFLKFAIRINAEEVENAFSLSCNAWQVYSKLLS